MNFGKIIMTLQEFIQGMGAAIIKHPKIGDQEITITERTIWGDQNLVEITFIHCTSNISYEQNLDDVVEK